MEIIAAEKIHGIIVVTRDGFDQRFDRFMSRLKRVFTKSMLKNIYEIFIGSRFAYDTSPASRLSTELGVERPFFFLDNYPLFDWNNSSVIRHKESWKDNDTQLRRLLKMVETSQPVDQESVKHKIVAEDDFKDVFSRYEKTNLKKNQLEFEQKKALTDLNGYKRKIRITENFYRLEEEYTRGRGIGQKLITQKVPDADMKAEHEGFLEQKARAESGLEQTRSQLRKCKTDLDILAREVSHTYQELGNLAIEFRDLGAVGIQSKHSLSHAG